MKYIIKGKKLVTVSKGGTITNGALLIEDGIIRDIGKSEDLIEKYPNVEVKDHSRYVITPGLVDCHTHLLEFAPTTLYANTEKTHFIAGRAILLKALSSGITALGEQICGHPLCNFSIQDYREVVKDFPMDISFATTSISIGLEELSHFTSITKSKAVERTFLVSHDIVRQLAENSDYPGENIFINATPANFTEDMVPRAGEIVYSLDELKEIVQTFHNLGKKIGCHVAGEKAIDWALEAGFDCLHHAHGITQEQMTVAADRGVHIVATPIGGTHLRPNSPEEIKRLLDLGIQVSISTDAYLPPYPDVSWLPSHTTLFGPDALMSISHPAMMLLKEQYEENEILAFITKNPAKLLGKEAQFGSLEPGLEANLIVAEGIPGLEITEIDKIKKVFYKGDLVISRN